MRDAAASACRNPSNGRCVSPSSARAEPARRPSLPQGTVTWGDSQALVSLGWSKNGGEGCYCDEHALLRQLLRKASKETADITVIDSEAGLEHLSRGTIAGIDIALVVIEPGRRSLETADAIRRLAADLDIGHVYAVVTGCRSADEEASVLSRAPAARCATSARATSRHAARAASAAPTPMSLSPATSCAGSLPASPRTAPVAAKCYWR